MLICLWPVISNSMDTSIDCFTFCQEKCQKLNGLNGTSAHFVLKLLFTASCPLNTRCSMLISVWIVKRLITFASIRFSKGIKCNFTLSAYDLNCLLYCAAYATGKCNESLRNLLNYILRLPNFSSSKLHLTVFCWWAKYFSLQWQE